MWRKEKGVGRFTSEEWDSLVDDSEKLVLWFAVVSSRILQSYQDLANDVVRTSDAEPGDLESAKGDCPKNEC
jgi:hypothetical protein